MCYGADAAGKSDTSKAFFTTAFKSKAQQDANNTAFTQEVEAYLQDALNALPANTSNETGARKKMEDEAKVISKDQSKFKANLLDGVSFDLKVDGYDAKTGKFSMPFLISPNASSGELEPLLVDDLRLEEVARETSRVRNCEERARLGMDILKDRYGFESVRVSMTHARYDSTRTKRRKEIRGERESMEKAGRPKSEWPPLMGFQMMDYLRDDIRSRLAIERAEWEYHVAVLLKEPGSYKGKVLDGSAFNSVYDGLGIGYLHDNKDEFVRAYVKDEHFGEVKTKELKD